MKDCKKCNQTVENCECHISSREKNSGLYKMCKDLSDPIKKQEIFKQIRRKK